MDTIRWKPGDEFPVLDLVARLEAKTAAGLVFELGKSVDRHTPRLPEMEPDEDRIDGRDKWDWLLETGSIFFVLGWLDAHHPCEGRHSLRVRVGLPDRYVIWENLRDLVPQVVAALGLPAGVSYRVSLSGLSECAGTCHPPEGFESTSEWQRPG